MLRWKPFLKPQRNHLLTWPTGVSGDAQKCPTQGTQAVPCFGTRQECRKEAEAGLAVGIGQAVQGWFLHSGCVFLSHRSAWIQMETENPDGPTKGPVTPGPPKSRLWATPVFGGCPPLTREGLAPPADPGSCSPGTSKPPKLEVWAGNPGASPRGAQTGGHMLLSRRGASPMLSFAWETGFHAAKKVEDSCDTCWGSAVHASHLRASEASGCALRSA